MITPWILLIPLTIVITLSLLFSWWRERTMRDILNELIDARIDQRQQFEDAQLMRQGMIHDIDQYLRGIGEALATVIDTMQKD